MNTQSLKTIDNQLTIENDKLISLGVELKEKADWMMSVSGRPEFKNRQEVYFPLLKEWRAQKCKVGDLYEQRAELLKTEPSKPLKSAEQIEMEEKRALKEAMVTSTTYERAQKRLFKEVDGFLCGSTARH